MGPSADAPVKRADARANRDALLSAAAQIYAEGAGAVSCDEIAKLAGVGRATLYRHFPTRDALTTALLEQFIVAIEDATALPAAPGSLFEVIGETVRVTAANVALLQALPPRDALPDSAIALRRRYEMAFGDHLDVARADGTVAPDVTVADVRIVLYMLAQATYPGSAPGDEQRAWRLARAALGASPLPAA